jgi:hypothetical protein
MATFSFSRDINIHWNGYDVKGPAGTVFSIPDQLYEEFEGDIRNVEPSLTWIDTNEFQTLTNNVSAATLSASLPIALTTTTSGKTISLSSTTALNGYLLAADGTGGTIWTPASTSSLTSVIGIDPISTVISGGTVSVSLNASYSTSTHLHDSDYVNVGGDTMSGQLLVSSASTTSTVGFGEIVVAKGTSYGSITVNATDDHLHLRSKNPIEVLGQSGPTMQGLRARGLGVNSSHTYPTLIDDGITFGEDANLYRVSANALKTDDALEVVGTLTNGGTSVSLSTHTHPYQPSGTYVNAVIGTSPASVSTASGTSTVSIIAASIDSTHLADNAVVAAKIAAAAVGTAAISSGAATSGQVLQANGSGGVSFGNAAAGFNGPVSSIDNSLPRFDGTGGVTVQGSSVIVDDSNDVFFPSAIGYSPVSVSLATNTYTINLSSGIFFNGITAGPRIDPTFITSRTVDYGAATSGTILGPTGMLKGDTVVVAIGTDGGTSVAAGTAAESALTKVFGGLGGASGGAYGYIFIGTLTADGQTNFGTATGFLTATTAVALAFRGVSTWEDINSSSGGSGMPTAPIVTATSSVARVGVIFGFLDDDNVTGVTAPTGFSDIVQQSSSVAGFTTMAAWAEILATSTTVAAFGGSGSDEWLSASLVLIGSRGDRTVTLSSPPSQVISGFATATAHTIIIRVLPGSGSEDVVLSWDPKIVWSGQGTPASDVASLVVLTTYDGVTYYGTYSNFV